LPQLFIKFGMKFISINEIEMFFLGKISKIHGVRGEIILPVENSFLDSVSENFTLKSGFYFLEIEGQKVPFFADKKNISVRDKNQNVECIFSFETVDSVEKAKEIVGANVYTSLSKNLRNKLEKREIIGYKVYEKTAGKIGKVREILRIPKNNLLRVRNKEKETLIPFRKEFITKISHKNHKIFFIAPEGLLNL